MSHFYINLLIYEIFHGWLSYILWHLGTLPWILQNYRLDGRFGNINITLRYQVERGMSHTEKNLLRTLLVTLISNLNFRNCRSKRYHWPQLLTMPNGQITFSVYINLWSFRIELRTKLISFRPTRIAWLEPCRPELYTWTIFDLKLIDRWLILLSK